MATRAYGSSLKKASHSPSKLDIVTHETLIKHLEVDSVRILAPPHLFGFEQATHVYNAHKRKSILLRYSNEPYDL